MIASIRRTFAAEDVSCVILKTPISAVERTCVPPQSSREKPPSPTSTIRTTSPYFSPNSAIAPSDRASSERRRQRPHGLVLEDHLVDAILDPALVLVAQRRAVREVEAQLVRADVGARLAHVRPEPLAQRGVQEVRGGVVALGRAPRGAIHARAHALAVVQRARQRLQDQRLVIAQPHDVDDLRAAAAVLALDHAAVMDLAAAGRVERRLDQLGDARGRSRRTTEATAVACSVVS